MSFCYNKLLGRIVEVCGTRQKFAELMGMSDAALRNKLNGDSMFKQDEILKACRLLRVESNDLPAYFFTAEVQKTVLQSNS